LDYIIRTCLAKDPDERFQTAHDVKLQLSWLLQSGGVVSRPPATEAWAWRHRVSIALAGAAMLALLLVLLVTTFRTRPAAPAYGITRFTIALPARQELAADGTQAVVLSPDGKRLAYVSAESGISHLYVRRLDQFDSTAIPDSEGTTFPFFSPNGDWIAFFSQGKLKKAPTDGGDPVVVCELPTFFGGTWTPQDVIVVAVPNYGLATVPANGGSLQKISIATKENLYPQGPIWLPGNDWILFTDYFASRRRVMALKLGSGEVRQLVNNAQGASYAAGQLVYYSGGALWSVPFDSNKVAIVGSAAQVESGVDEENYVAQANVSQTGVLVYAPGPAGNSTRNLYFVNRSGSEQKIDVPSQDYVDPAISPDGRRVAISIRRVSEQQLAVFDRDRDVLTSLVRNGALNNAPVWTPDGKDLLFDAVGSSQKRGIYRIAADGDTAPQLIRETSLNSHLTAIAGDHAAVMVNDPITSADLWLLTLRDPYEMRPFKRTPATERQGALSPDGQWLAYASNESGRSEIYVEQVSGRGGRWQTSTNGGEQPRWVRSGREILYRSGTKMMSVPVQVQPVFRSSKPVELFDHKFDRGGAAGGYDVTRDGQTFVMTRTEHASPTEIRVVIGWAAGKRAQP
jgi:Tol biopolymer transport system component